MIVVEELWGVIHHRRVEAHTVAFPQAIHFAFEGQRKLRGVEVMVVISNRYRGVFSAQSFFFFTS